MWTSAVWFLEAHRLNHAEHGERVDEAGRALSGGGAFTQLEALGDMHHAVLRVHLAGDRADHFALERLGGLARAGLDDDAGAFVSRRQGLVEAIGLRGHQLRRDRGGEDRVVGSTGQPGLAHVGWADEQAQIGWVDR